MSLWTWPWRRPSADAEVTAATREFVDGEIGAEQSARRDLAEALARIVELEQELVDERVAYGTLAGVTRSPTTTSPEALWLKSRRSEEAQRARKFARMYGRASATIGHLRADLARTREQRDIARRLLAERAMTVTGSTINADDLSREVVEFEGQPVDEKPIGLSTLKAFRSAVDPNRGARADGCGGHTRDLTAAIDGAATTLGAHRFNTCSPSSLDACVCGWHGDDHLRHVAEHLAAVGALAHRPPKPVEPYLLKGDLVRLRVSDVLATGRAHTAHVVQDDDCDLVLDAPAPRPTPRTGSFTTGPARGLTGEA